MAESATAPGAASVPLDLAFVSEFSLPGLVWRVLRRRPVAVLAVSPLIPRLSGTLRRLVERWQERGAVVDLYARWPSLAPMREFRYEAYTRLYLCAEPWMARHFAFDRRTRALCDYGQAYRHVTFGHVDRLARPVLVMAALAAQGCHGRLIGADAALAGLYEAWTGSPPPWRVRHPRPLWRLVNLTLALAIFAAGAAFVARRTRVRVAPEARFLGATFVLDPRHYAALRDIVDRDDDVTTIFLTRDDAVRHGSDPDGFRGCTVTDGRFDLPTAASAIAILLRDTTSLLCCAGADMPAHFRGMLRLVLRRVAYRGLFRRYRFRHLWCRDDYNAEHIVRTQELRRIGGTSLGINHGLPATDIIEPGWRYLDFDIYYVFGRHLYERYYRETWPATMTVRAVGSFGMTRRQLARLNAPRTRDIVYYVNPGPFEAAQSREVMRLALALPDRRILVRIKPSRRIQGYCTETLALLRDAPPNVVESEENSYELMLLHGYAVCGLSTVAAEALQFGMSVFVFDVQPEELPNYFRDFPGLCVSSGAEIARRIRAIESGAETYDRRRYDDLVALDGPVIYDAIRADLGLPPKEMRVAA